MVRFVERHHQSFFEHQIRDAFMPFGAPAVVRADVTDLRTHLCLFLLPPYGRQIAPAVDIKALQGLGGLVNLVPVVARAESLSPRDCEARAHLVRSTLDTLRVPVYLPPARDAPPPAEPWPCFLPTLVAAESPELPLPSRRVYAWGDGDGWHGVLRGPAGALS